MRSLSTALASITLLLAAASFAESEPPLEAPSITPAEIQSRRESGRAPTIIDVRTPEEYAAGHIPGAVNIPYDQVAERIDTIEAPHGVALYCMVGPRARKGEAALLAAGHEAVLHLDGGMAAWQAAGLPIVQEP